MCERVRGDDSDLVGADGWVREVEDLSHVLVLPAGGLKLDTFLFVDRTFAIKASMYGCFFVTGAKPLKKCGFLSRTFVGVRMAAAFRKRESIRSPETGFSFNGIQCAWHASFFVIIEHNRTIGLRCSTVHKRKANFNCSFSSHIVTSEG